MARRSRSSKMKAGTCKCLRNNRKLCKLSSGKVVFRGKCRKGRLDDLDL